MFEIFLTYEAQKQLDNLKTERIGNSAMDFQLDRPGGYHGEADQYLPDVIRDLKRVLIKTQDSFSYKTLYLSKRNLGELASVLVEFAEDIHDDIGIWEAVERYYLEFFGIRLPFIPQSNENAEPKELNKLRICHLLWVLYPEIKPQLVLSPTHKGLFPLATVISDFLEDRFAKIPRGSGIKTFLAQSNTFGWDIKKKLVWLGQHSYLFRHCFQNYLKDNGGRAVIPVIDDFICQETTAWSGLGVIDILAAALDITKVQRSTLRRWYERHAALYKIVKIEKEFMEAVNLINDKLYTIRVGEGITPFEAQQVVFGSLAPWNDEWYWSGEQKLYNNISDEVLPQLKNTFLQTSARVAYRYCEQLAEKTKERVKIQYHDFVKYHGNDFVIYPDGLSLAADMQKEYRLLYESQPKEAVSEVMKKHNLQNPWARISLPPQIMNANNGIGVYFNESEGQEIMAGFNDVVSGFRKKGIDLTEDEKDAIRDFVYSDSISPQFVKKLVYEYGDASIASAFLISENYDAYYLDYLLRRHKGHFYKNRYPCVSFV